MRRLANILSVLLVSAALVSCMKSELVGQSSETIAETITFTASSVADSTKTHLNDNLECIWDTNDKLYIFRGNLTKSMYSIDPKTAGSTEANFIGQDSDSFTGGTEGSGTKTFDANVAVYPSSIVGDLQHAGDLVFSVGVNLPATQTYYSRSYGNGDFPMVAVTDGLAKRYLSFKNVYGAFCFKMLGDNVTIKSIEILGNNGEALSGNATIHCSVNGLPTVSFDGAGGKSITLNCGDGIVLNSETPTEFYIAIPPVTFTKGITLNIRTANGLVLKQTATATTISRNAIKPIKAFTVVDVAPADPEDYVDEYGINHGKGTAYKGVVWAPVNCGYKTASLASKGYPYGKLYQFGRKTGVGYKDSNYEDETYATFDSRRYSGPVGEDDPCVIYGGGDEFWTYNWNLYSQGSPWNAGTESSPIKTDYDPCPEGWRIPSSEELSTLSYIYTTYSNGAYSVNGIKFPAAGCASNNTYYNRNNSSYQVLSLSSGYYDDEDGDGVYALKKTGSSSYTSYVGYSSTVALGNAFPVRCVMDKNNDKYRTEINYIASKQVVPNTEVMSSYLPSESKYNSTTKKGVMVFSGMLSELPANAFDSQSAKEALELIDIPGTINTIGGSAFHHTPLKAVVLNEGTTILKQYWLENTPYLQSITLPSSISQVWDFGANAGVKVIEFKGARPSIYHLTDFNGIAVAYPSSEKSRYSSYFTSSSLIEVKAGESLSELSYSTSNGTEISFDSDIIWDQPIKTKENGKIVFYSPVTSIPMDAFKGKKNLVAISLPKSIRRVESDAFNSCDNLTKVTNIDYVDYFNEMAFQNCSKLTVTTLNATELCTSAFENCKSITSLSLPKVKKFGSLSLAGCTSLSSVSMGANVTSLSSYIFSNTAVKRISIQTSTAPSINSNTFYNMPTGGVLIHSAATSSAFSSWMTYLRPIGWTDNDGHSYVDLGLPSGTLWADENASGEWSSDWVLPTSTQFYELMQYTDGKYSGSYGYYRGCDFTSTRNGNVLSFPAQGYGDIDLKLTNNLYGHIYSDWERDDETIPSYETRSGTGSVIRYVRK